MPGGGPRKPLHLMTRREIISTMIAFALIGGIIIAATLYQAIFQASGWFAIVPACGAFFVTVGVCSTEVSAWHELRRRKPTGMTVDEDQI